MICNNCGNPEAWQWFKRSDSEGCNACDGQHTYQGVRDVYFKGPYWDENLSSAEHPGPKFITSKSEKAYWLKQCHLREAGDRVHGATSFDPKYSRIAHENFRNQQEAKHVRRNAQ